ncbi:MAG: YkgJ family cysteine cluster protein [Marinomonas hwangdonensis]|nr:YkgJ family cysteine cluster protein [Marinomonas hwangdonensis]
MQCRPLCGACCTAPSITSYIPGMPQGKPAGVPCIQLTETYQCALFNDPARPKVCSEFSAEEYVCGSTRQSAIDNLTLLESETVPITILTLQRTYE